MLAEAFAAAEAAGVRGKAVTPFLLGFIVDASGGRSLEVNLDLARNNVRVAADIATAWSQRSAVGMSGDRIVVVGDVINDIVVVPRGEIRPDTDTASTIRLRPGGSAANTAAWLGLARRAGRLRRVRRARRPGRSRAGVPRRGRRCPHLQLGPGLPTGTIVILVDGERRTMLTERGANSRAVAAARSPTSCWRSAGVLHISGYSILDGFGVAGRARPDRPRDARRASPCR